MATSRLSSAVAVTVGVLLLLLVIAAATTLTRTKRTPVVGEEGFQSSLNEDTGQVFADTTRCKVATSDDNYFTFASEGLAAHPQSTPSDPKCVIVRSGMGLLKSDDTKQCEVLPNHSLYNWTNPLQQTMITKEIVSSIPRCVMNVDNTTAETLAELDKKLMEEGASIRSGYPELKYHYDLLETQLGKNTDELSRSTGKLKDTSTLLNNTMDTVRLKKEQRDNTMKQLVALAFDDATAMNGVDELYSTAIKDTVDNIDSEWTRRLSVTVYDDIQFGGRGVVKNPGFYDVDKIGLSDKTIRSIKIEPGMWIQVFQNSARGGEWKVFKENKLDLTQVPMSSGGGKNWKNQISSILVGAGPTPDESKPTPLGDMWYGSRGYSAGGDSVIAQNVGECVRMCVDKEGGDCKSMYYTSTDKRCYRFVNRYGEGDVSRDNKDPRGYTGNVSSPSGYVSSKGGVVTVYQDANFSGPSSTKEKGIYTMSSMGVENDSISSVSVSPGMWIQLFQNKKETDDGGDYVVIREDVSDLRNVMMSDGKTSWDNQATVFTIGGAGDPLPAPAAPPSGSKSFVIKVEDTSADGLGRDKGYPGFAVTTGNDEFVLKLQASSYFTIDDGPKLTYASFNTATHFGKDVITYGPSEATFKSYTNHTFNVFPR